MAERVALVAGSSRGLGKAIAEAFLREGCRTVISGRNADALRHTHDEFEQRYGTERLLACPGDLADTAVIGATLGRVRQHWGPLDCVVANIGSGRGKPGWQ